MESDCGRLALSAAAHGVGAGRVSAVAGKEVPSFRAIGEAEIAACYGLMRQLRPHLTSVDEFIARWRRQSADGYRIVALWSEQGGPRALAGYRVAENLVHGKFLYVDDLIADQSERGRGYGARLLDKLKDEGRALGCRKLVLDTGLDNYLAHRFYFRQGLLAQALRFNIPL
jgi:ribosomal protein S18 acetylase RimI-like enzyme